MMKKKAIQLLILVLLAESLVISISADEILVTKYVEKSQLKVGEDLRIFLKLTNPFNESLRVRIKDHNSVGGSTLEIECYEAIIPAKRTFTLEYEPLAIYLPGNFTLSEAEVTYIDPISGKERVSKSNKLTIKVSGNMSGNFRATKTIRIYNCNGISLRQVSYGSYIGVGNVQINFPKQERNETTATIEEKDIIEKLEKILEKSLAFRAALKILEKENYSLIRKNFSKITKDVFNFTYSYVNPKGEKAKLIGKINLSNESVYDLKLIKIKEAKNKELLDLIKTSIALLFLGIIIIVIGYALYLKIRDIRKRQKMEIVASIDTNTSNDGEFQEIEENLERAKKLYESGDQKEAYSLLSYALKEYLKLKYELNNNFTNNELLSLLRKKNCEESKQIEKILKLCDLVKFAKLSPDRNVFYQTLEDIKRLVKNVSKK